MCDFEIYVVKDSITTSQMNKKDIPSCLHYSSIKSLVLVNVDQLLILTYPIRT